MEMIQTLKLLKFRLTFCGTLASYPGVFINALNTGRSFQYNMVRLFCHIP